MLPASMTPQGPVKAGSGPAFLKAWEKGRAWAEASAWVACLGAACLDLRDSHQQPRKPLLGRLLVRAVSAPFMTGELKFLQGELCFKVGEGCLWHGVVLALRSFQVRMSYCCDRCWPYKVFE